MLHFLLSATCALRYLWTYIINWETTSSMSISLDIARIPFTLTLRLKCPVKNGCGGDEVADDIKLITDRNEKD